MKDVMEKAKDNSTIMVLVAIVCFLAGILIGIIAAPVKKGLSIGSNNTIISGDDDDEDEEDNNK